MSWTCAFDRIVATELTRALPSTIAEPAVYRIDGKSDDRKPPALERRQIG